MNKTKRAKILTQVKQDRAARRLVEIERGLPKVVGTIHRTSKRDRLEKVSNTMRDW